MRVGNKNNINRLPIAPFCFYPLSRRIFIHLGKFYCSSIDDVHPWANSQLAAIVVLELPLLRLDRRIAVGHDEFLLALVDGQTLVRGSVPQQVRIRRVVPVLIALGAVARVQYHVLAGVVQAGLIPADFARFAQHPVLFFFLGTGTITKMALVVHGIS